MTCELARFGGQLGPDANHTIRDGGNDQGAVGVERDIIHGGRRFDTAFQASLVKIPETYRYRSSPADTSRTKSGEKSALWIVAE